MEITINFASQPYQQVQRFLLRWKIVISVVALLAFALLCSSVAAFLSWRTTRKQVVELRQQIEKQDRLRAEAETFLNRPENRQIRLRAEFLNSSIARKAFSWTEVFTDLEQIMPPRLRVTSIHPEVTSDDQLELHLMVSGSAREAGIDLVRRLESSSHFAQAQIKDERAGQTPDEAIQYSITAIYIPGFARGKSAPDQEETAHKAAAPPEMASNQRETSREQGNAGR